MSQVSTIVVANDTGAAVRAQLNLILKALSTCHGGATEPAEMFSYMLWFDPSSGIIVPKIRNGANNAWEELLDGGTF